MECKKNFPNSVLSLGWTTNYGGDIKEAFYTDDQIDEMIEAIKSTNSTEQEITFAVRAGIAAQSFDQTNKLKEITDSTLTIWSSEGDYVDTDLLRRLIFDYGLDRVYLDVPKELSDQLHLDDDGNSAGYLQSTVAVLFATFAATWIFN